MKVLFISSSSGSRGGGELYLLFLAEALLKHGVSVGLWCSTHSRMDELAESFDKLGEVFRSEYINTYDYKIRSIRYLFPKKKVRGLKNVINHFKPDLIHLNKQNIEDGLDLLKTLDEQTLPYITTIHITQTEKSLGAFFGGLRDSISKKIINQAKSKKWIAISPNRHQDLTNFIDVDKDKILMIPNGVKVQAIDDANLKKEAIIKLNAPENNLVVISVGRLETQKNPLKFIDWAEQCLKLNRRISFYWIGDGRLRNEFDDKIDILKLADHIKCLGWQNQVSTFYSVADVYVHTADFEGLPFSLLEAMSWRLPCVVSEELYHDLSFPEDVLYRGLEGLEVVINNKALRVEAGDRAHQYAKKNFSIEEIAKSYVEIYKTIAND